MNVKTTATPHCDARVGFYAGEFSEMPIACSATVGLSTWIDGTGRIRRGCRHHRSALLYRYPAVAEAEPLAFWSRVQKTETCWLWTGPLNRTGYGAVRGRGEQGTHRVAWALLRGPIPEGMTLDHLCRVRNCVNPDHLEPVTGRENTLRGNSFSATHARQTHCVNGHPFDDANTYRSTLGRACRACNQAASLRYRERRAARDDIEERRVAVAIERISADFTAELDEDVDDAAEFLREGLPEFSGQFR